MHVYSTMEECTCLGEGMMMMDHSRLVYTCTILLAVVTNALAIGFENNCLVSFYNSR